MSTLLSGCSCRNLTRTIDKMQEMASDINKMRRLSSSYFAMGGLMALNLVAGDQLQKDSRSWLSPPDPSQNYNIACEIHQDGTATWFFRGSIFTEWNVKGSLLWIHGKRTCSRLALWRS